MNRCFLVFILSALIISCDTSSNVKPPYQNYFFKYFGPEGNQKAVDLLVRGDGTFYILGNSTGPDGIQKIYLAHVDAQGQLKNSTIYDAGNGSEFDSKDFLITTAGRLAVVANKKNGTNSSVMLIRFDLNSLTQLDTVSLKLGVSASANVYASSIIELSHGGFVITGYTDYTKLSNIAYDAVHFRTDQNLVQFNSNNTPGWNNLDGDQPIGLNENSTNKGIASFQDPLDSSKFIFFGTKNATRSGTYAFWTFSNGQGAYTYENLNSSPPNEILTSTLKTSDAGYLMAGLSISTNSSLTLKLARSFNNELNFNSNDFNITLDPVWNLGNYTSSSANLGTNDDLKAVACNSSSGGAFLVLSNAYNQSEDIWLMKFGSHNLVGLWSNPVIIGGDGDDSAAGVAELSDGRIIVLATMSVGSVSNGGSFQKKIALLKLNDLGKLAD